MTGIRWTEQAVDDIRAIRQHIERDSPLYGRLVAERLFAASERLRDFPRSGRIVPELDRGDVREIIVGERFFKSFASSPRAHYTEQAIRLLIGGSIILFSPAMWQSDLFRLIGWVVVVSAAGLLLLPWRWHHRFAEWAIPLVLRRMRTYAVGLFAFGAFLLFGAGAG